MTDLILSPRIELGIAVPVRSPSARPGLALVAVCVVAPIPLILALVGEGVLYRLACAALFPVMLLFVFYGYALTASVRSGIVRLRGEHGLRFVPPAAVIVLPFVIAAVGVVMGVLAVLALGQPGESFGRGPRTIWGVLVVGALAAAWLVQSLVGLGRTVGLRLSAWGLEGVRGGPAVRLPWGYLERAEAIPTRRGAALMLVLIEGNPLVILGQDLGSDPNVVAAIIEHYRTHPEDEDLLSDAVAAIRRVEAAGAERSA